MAKLLTRFHIANETNACIIRSLYGYLCRGTVFRKTEIIPFERKKSPVLFRKTKKKPISRNCVPQTEEKSRIAERKFAKSPRDFLILQRPEFHAE